MLMKRTVTAFDHLVGLNYQAALGQTSWNHFLTQFAASLGACSVRLFSRYEQHTKWSRGQTMEADSCVPLDRIVACTEQWVHDGSACEVGSVYSPAPLDWQPRLPRHVRHRRLRARRVLRPWLFGAVALRDTNPTDDDTYCAVVRSSPMDKFDVRDRNLLRSMLPHLRNAAEIDRKLKVVTVWQRTLENALDHFAAGVVVTNANLEVQWCNGAMVPHRKCWTIVNP